MPHHFVPGRSGIPPEYRRAMDIREPASWARWMGMCSVQQKRPSSGTAAPQEQRSDRSVLHEAQLAGRGDREHQGAFRRQPKHKVTQSCRPHLADAPQNIPVPIAGCVHRGREAAVTSLTPMFQVYRCLGGKNMEKPTEQRRSVSESSTAGNK